MICSYAFRVMDNYESRRRLVQAENVLSAYSVCNPRCELTRPSWLSAFWYGEDFREYLAEHGTPRGFDGVCWSPFLWFDIDRDDLEEAQADTARLCRLVQERYRIEPIIFFSGGKGFHIGVSVDAPPSRHFNQIARRVAEHIAEGIEIDPAVYVKVQPFRLPNSRHNKTGLYKRYLTLAELEYHTTKQICQLAGKPERFTLPDNHKCDLLRVLWQKAEQEANKSAEIGGVMTTQHTDEVAHLNRDTLEFIREGASIGERARRLYMASANLAEMGCPPALAYALLIESALDCGLSPTEARRQIQCGLRKGANG